MSASAPDRGARVNRSLTEARTVLSRAETGVAYLTGPPGRAFPDEDRADVVEALGRVAEILAPFRRTSRRRP